MGVLRVIPADQFLKSRAGFILLLSCAVATLEFCVLFLAARSEDVLILKNGVGLLEQYGFYSSIVGDAFLLFFSKKYADIIFDLQNYSIIEKASILDKKIESLRAALCLQTRHRMILYLFIFVGVAAFVSNISYHLLGLAESHWGGPVFDSPDHVLCFILNKIATLYSWIFVLPFCLYVMLICSLYLHKIINQLIENKQIKYDLLNPDRCGGFSFIGSSQVFFNVAASIVYVQIILHSTAFGVINFEYIVSYFIITMFFIFGNTFFIGGLYTQIIKIRNEALDFYKNKIYNDDLVSFEIYKYYHESFFKGLYTKKAIAIINFTRTISVGITLAVNILKFI